jgi:protein TonB
MSNYIYLIIRLSLILILGVSTVHKGWAQSMPDAVGKMEKGRKVGVWEYYGSTTIGERVVIQRYDHDAQKLVYYRPAASTTYHVETSPGNWQYVRPDQPPLFIGGSPVLASYIAKLIYPQSALDRHVEGLVIVTLQIDTLGRATDFRLTKRVSLECDEAAMKVARNIPQTWVPARIGSRAVAAEYELPFNFKMSKQ